MRGTELRFLALVVLFLGVVLVPQAQAQIDPYERELIQIGYNQPVEGRGPIAGYGFFYYNQPGWLSTNLTLRLAVAPVYLDSELGISHVLGENTDIGLGLAGGGFADGYSEIRHGKLIQGESFVGHSAEASLSLYHRFNPLPEGHEPTSIGEIPLQGLVRISPHYSVFGRDNDTLPDFKLPEDRVALHVRTGLRWGGREPVILPDRAFELSAWYDGQFRTDASDYGLNGERVSQNQTHLFWGRALVALGITNSPHHLELSVTAGTSIRADRLSAYRLGGALPLMGEFPLSVPGYYFQEFSASKFALVSGTYWLALTPSHRWELLVNGATAGMDYLPGLKGNRNWVSGLGGGIGYHSVSGAWHVIAAYEYGFDAERSSGYGANNITLLLQIDLERSPRAQQFWHDFRPSLLRGLDGILRR
jgi:hypothetical protein